MESSSFYYKTPALIPLTPISSMKKEKNKKAKVGDRVWLKIPHNGKVEFVYKNGDVRIELDPIGEKTVMSRFAASAPNPKIKHYQPNPYIKYGERN